MARTAGVTVFRGGFRLRSGARAKALWCELQEGQGRPAGASGAAGAHGAAPQQGGLGGAGPTGPLRPCACNGTTAKCGRNSPNTRNRKNCSRRTSLTSITQLGIWSSVPRDKQNNGEVFSVFLSNCIIVRLSCFKSKRKIWTRTPTEKKKHLRDPRLALPQTG